MFGNIGMVLRPVLVSNEVVFSQSLTLKKQMSTLALGQTKSVFSWWMPYLNQYLDFGGLWICSSEKYRVGFWSTKTGTESQVKDVNPM